MCEINVYDACVINKILLSTHVVSTMRYRVFFTIIDFADTDCDISFFINRINEQHFPMGS